MNKEPLVSVVLPVYNAKNYVRDTIGSILNQTFGDFELVIIDDGSTDGSKEICENLANRDMRIRLQRQDNHGICYSRNKAIEIARGKYIAFCDHDDLFEPEYLELLVNAAEKNNADLVKAQYKGIVKDNGVEIVNTTMDFLDGECSLERLLKDYRYFLRTINVLWNGLYIRKIIINHSIKFDPSFKAGWEDNLFNLEYLKRCEKIFGVNKLIYSHIRRTGQSASLGYNAHRADDLIKIYHVETEYLDQHKEIVNGQTFIDHQLRFLTALKTELWYNDCPLSAKEKQEKIKTFIDEKLDFRNVSVKDVLLSFKNKPKATIKWFMFHFGMSRLLCMYWNLAKE